MKLQAELVEVDQRNLTERVDKIKLNDNRLRLRCLFFPDSFFQRKKAILDEPGEGDGAIVHDSGRGTWLPYLFCDLTLQRFTGFEFGHLRFQPENDRNANSLLLVRG